MTTSAVTICSNALLLLGDNPISDFNENSDRARLAANLWEPVRNFVLRSHPWKCATKRVALAPDADGSGNLIVPAMDYAMQFTLPNDFMKILQVGEYGAEVDYREESGKLLADDNPLLLKYIWRNDNPATYDDMLVWGLTNAMKAVFAYPITQSTSLEQLVEDAIKDLLRQARAVDGQDNPAETMGDTPLLNSRFSGSRWWRR